MIGYISFVNFIFVYFVTKKKFGFTYNFNYITKTYHSYIKLNIYHDKYKTINRYNFW